MYSCHSSGEYLFHHDRRPIQTGVLGTVSFSYCEKTLFLKEFITADGQVCLTIGLLMADSFSADCHCKPPPPPPIFVVVGGCFFCSFFGGVGGTHLRKCFTSSGFCLFSTSLKAKKNKKMSALLCKCTDISFINWSDFLSFFFLLFLLTFLRLRNTWQEMAFRVCHITLSIVAC